MFMTLNISAHEGGHGPAIADESLHGGKVTGIILEKEAEIGRKATLKYKAELTYESRKTEVKLYLYDQKMQPLDLTKFATEVKAVQIEKSNERPFKLTLDKSKKYFVGTRPKNKRVPFSIDVFPKLGEDNLFGAFDGLD